MKTLPEGLQAHLDSGTTTLCWCWRLTRRDGAQLGFTDHDRALVFDGTAFEAASGFSATEIKESVGLAIDNLDVQGALSSDRLSEGDLAAGLYDDAAIEIFRVNWQAPAQRVLMRAGSLGEIRRGDVAFTAEVRGLAHYLQQPKGRLFQYACDADLGDARCGVDLTTAGNRAAGAVLTVTANRLFTASGLGHVTSGWLTRGLLTWTSGANSGQAIELRRHSLTASIATLELWQAASQPIASGDTFSVTAGCDKQLATCRDKFANVVNFRGFPHMPGNDYVLSVARPGVTGTGTTVIG